MLAMAEGMATSALRWPGLVGLTSRRYELLASSDTFEAWVIGWPPGGTIELHDHGTSAGAVAVAGGELVETLVSEGEDGAVTTSRRRMAAGTSWVMGRRHIHDVVNHGSLPAVSVHVYAPRLTSMTHYRIIGGRLRPEKTVRYQMGHVVP
jgi:predicted metal-dependent enzyme (double-stranded beta helix superfamily)